MNLLHRHRIKPRLHDPPDGAEAPRSVDQIQTTEAFGVVVLAQDAGLLDIVEHLGRLGDADALEIHDGAARLEEDARLAGAGREAGVGDALVLDREVGQHALGRGDLVHGCEINVAELLDVDGPAILMVGLAIGGGGKVEPR